MAIVQKKPILIVGGGITGITAAVEIAEVGHEVVLIEQEAYLGGNVVKMNNYFPKLCPPACGLEINFRRIRNNSRISVYISTIAENIQPDGGTFKVSLRQAPQYVKNTCTACGKCTEVCPVDKPDAFNYGFTNTKAISLPHEMAFPMKYFLDDAYCRKDDCGKCVGVCDYNAIDLSAKDRQFQLEAASVIVGTGWKNYEASKIALMQYDTYENVVSNVEFERLIAPGGPGNGKLLRPSDKEIPNRIAFVQCAGSRDENHLPYCSSVCCSASLKHALTVQERYPQSTITIFYIDLRVTGRNEDFLARVQENDSITLVKGKVAGIKEIAENGNLLVEAEDVLSGRKVQEEVDLVVLATGIVSAEVEFNPKRDTSGFVLGEQLPGIFAAGCSKKPMDVSSSVKDATAASLKAIQYKVLNEQGIS